jgi:hypothetical protein
MIINGDAGAVAEHLANVMAETSADALNLRVHVPGLSPAEVIEQIDQLAAVLNSLRAHPPTREPS